MKSTAKRKNGGGLERRGSQGIGDGKIWYGERKSHWEKERDYLILLTLTK